MKVLENNYVNHTNKEVNKQTNSYPREFVCENCTSKLEYEMSDLHMGVLGCMHLRCPLCGYDNMLEENENTITLTADNVEFPVHFFHISKETGAVDCCNNKEVKKCIKKAIDFFREHKEEYFWFSEYGNLYINVMRCDGDKDYCVFVSNDYYNTYISFEDEDYNYENC